MQRILCLDTHRLPTSAALLLIFYPQAKYSHLLLNKEYQSGFIHSTFPGWPVTFLTVKTKALRNEQQRMTYGLKVGKFFPHRMRNIFFIRWVEPMGQGHQNGVWSDWTNLENSKLKISVLMEVAFDRFRWSATLFLTWIYCWTFVQSHLEWVQSHLV